MPLVVLEADYSSRVIADSVSSLIFIVVFALALTCSQARLPNIQVPICFAGVPGAAIGIFVTAAEISRVLHLPVQVNPETFRILAGLTFVLSAIVCLRSRARRDSLCKLRLLIPVLVVPTIVSTAILIVASQNGLTPPGNDVLNSGLIIDSQRRLHYSPICQHGVTSDVHGLVDLRFEACGAWLLGDLFDLGVSSSILSNLLLPFLLTPFMLAAGLHSILKALDITLSKATHNLIAVSSVQFLMFPWGTNGLPRFTLGLALLLCSFGLLLGYLRGQKVLFLFVLNYIGILYVHVIPFLILTGGVLLVMLVCERQILRRRATLSVLSLLSALFFVNSSDVFQSTRNITQIALGDAYLQQLRSSPPLERETPSSVANSEPTLQVLGILESAARAGIQLALYVICAVGVMKLLRSRESPKVLIAVMSLVLFIADVLAGFEFSFFSRLFGERLRITALSQLLLLVPVAIGLDAVLRSIAHNFVYRSLYRHAALTAVVVLLLTNVVAGLRIYSTAWARQALPVAIESSVVWTDEDININRESLLRWLSLIREK